MNLFTLLSFGLAVVVGYVAACETPAIVNCGDNVYDMFDIDAAIVAAMDFEQSGNRPNNYPHRFKNYEGMEFCCEGGPYSEFPLISNGLYFSTKAHYRSPGPDRVIFSTETGDFCGVVTHTGTSSRNAFLSCSIEPDYSDSDSGSD